MDLAIIVLIVNGLIPNQDPRPIPEVAIVGLLDQGLDLEGDTSGDGSSLWALIAVGPFSLDPFFFLFGMRINPSQLWAEQKQKGVSVAWTLSPIHMGYYFYIVLSFFILIFTCIMYLS